MRSDLRQGREEGKRPSILTANPEAIMLEEEAGSCSAHQEEQGCFTADNFKRKKFLLNTKVTWLWSQASGLELKLGRHQGTHVLSLGNDQHEVQLSTVLGCAMGERTPKNSGDCFPMLQALQGLLQKIQFLSLHLRNNEECMGKSGRLPWLGSIFHTKCSLKHWLSRPG